MQRKLLFRAWDAIQKHYVYFEIYQGANNHTPPIYTRDSDLEPWEQWTALPDITGTIIYEHDILEFTYPSQYGMVIDHGVMVFDPTRACFGMDMFTNLNLGKHVESSMPPKIIGDIHQTPHLIPESLKWVYAKQ